MKQKIEKVWGKWGKRLILYSEPGKWTERLNPSEGPPLKEDRLLSIDTNGRYYFSHDELKFILRTVLDNDILPHVFEENCNIYTNTINELKRERKHRIEEKQTTLSFG
jgi:predicted DNA-binding helix-hairpin-helix protein